MRNALALLLFLGLAWAQSDANKGQIVGTVYDPNQAVIPGASVKIRNLDTGFTRELTSNESGQYRALALDPGRYEVVAQSSGFSPTTVSGLVLNVGSTVSANVTLQVQATTTVVEVGETLVSVTPQASRVVDNQAIRDLPINGRRFQDLALVTPTVQVDPQRGQISIAGQRGINSNVMVDGADYNQPFFGGIRGGERSNLVFTVPQSSIQEFQTIATGYAAEYGRSTGGMINAITKTGTNNYHGDAFYQLRHKELGLKTPFNRQSLETQHQYGGSIGGPIQRDKLFFFGAIERQKSNIPRLVFFPRLREITPTPDVLDAYNYWLGAEKPFTQTNDATALDTRADYAFASGSRLTFRYNMSRGDALNSTTTGTSINPTINRTLSNNGTERDRTHTGNAQYTAILSPAVLNDLRFAVSAEIRPRDANTPFMPTVGTTIGTDGTVNFLSNSEDDKRIQINDGLSVTRGPHTFKFGVDFNHLYAWQIFGFNQFGAFSISGSSVQTHLDILTPGGRIANRFDDPSVTYNRQIGNMLVDLAAEQVAAYAQDSWRLAPTFTLDYGLRWEGQWNPQPAANNTDVLNRVKGFNFPIGSVDPTRIQSSPAQFMPRAGFAWTPSASRRTVVRGNTGIFYAATPLLLFTSPLNNFRQPPGDVSLQLPRAGSTVYKDLLAAGVDLNQYTLDKLPIIPVDVVQRAAAGAGAAPDPFRGANLLSMASDFKNPRAFQAGLGLDSEITRNLVVGAQLYYVNTVHLQRNRDFNLPLPIIRPTDKALRPFFGLRAGGRTRPVPTLGSIWVRESGSRSMYRGMTLSSQYRTGRFQFGAFYTYSATFSTDDNERDATGFRMENSFNLKPEYNYSDFDMRHQFAGFGVVTLPLGIELSTTMRFTTGRPIDPSTGADTAESVGGANRAYQAPGVPYLRNSFRNRGFRNVDLRFLKTFPIRERFKIQFSTEMFNLFNFSNVVYAGNNTNYGLGVDPATGATLSPQPSWRRLKLADSSFDPVNVQLGNPFQAQLGLRFLF